jgi:tape measure domain-containing protein
MAEYRLEFVADGSQASRTIAQLEKAIKEITKEFKNAEIGSEDFLAAASQISVLTQETNKAKSAVIDLDKAQKQLSKTIAEQQRAIMQFRAGMGAKGAIPGVASPIRGTATTVGSPAYYEATEKAAQRAKQAAQQIQPPPRAFAPGSLAAYEQKLKTLRDQARLISPETGKWRELTKEIKEAEKSISKINKKQAPGLSLGQRAGAAGGAFLYGGGLGGGIGSALGGVAGGLAGGVSGAFTGAALGQLIDNLGSYAAVIAETAADVNKARIALAGVTQDAQDYDKALEAVTASSQKFLLPIVDATQQFTKLQASVVGAGYDTTVTTQAFNAIGAAIIATGGTTEDLNGALRATAQVFSKGKVSAEELRQQIGERLPGAFTIFAQSIGKTPQQLDKLLEEGKVTLDDFIKFLGELDKRYGTTAELLAKAPENAGARLRVALQAASVVYGGFFQKVGAGFQGYLTDLVNFVLKNQEQVKKLIATFAVAAQDIYTIFSNLINSLAPLFSDFFKFIFTNFAQGVNALANLGEQSRLGAGGPEQRAAKSVEALYPNPIERALKGGPAFREALGVEIQREKGLASRQQSRAARVTAMGEQMFTPFRPTQFGAGIGRGGATGGGAISSGGGAAKAGKGRESRLPELTEELNLTRQLLAIDRQITAAELGGNQLAAIRLNGTKEQLRIQSEIAKVRLQQDVPLLEQQLQIEKLRLDAERERLETNAAIQKQIQTELQGVQDAMIGIATTAKNELEGRREYEKLIESGLAPAIAQITVEVRQQFSVEVEKLKMLEKQALAEISILEAKQNQTDSDKEQLQILRDRLDLIQGGIAEAPSLAGATIESRTQKQLMEDRPKSATAFLAETAKEAQANLEKLTNWGYQTAEGAKAIGSAFGQAFKDIASGSKTTQEALASMFESIASHFLDMAAQMIAQMITMFILKSLIGLFGGGGGFSYQGPNYSSSFGSGGPAFNPGAFSMPKLAAEGAYWTGGFKAFADGGVVAGPTLGLVGEGGEPEYIIPASKMSSAMARYSAGARGNAVIPAEGGEGISSMSIGAPASAIDVRYSVERINSVDYVTADQFQRGMAQAAQQGAKQGEQMTLRRLQQSRSTRGRLGLN